MNKLRLFLMVLALGISTVALADDASVENTDATNQAACAAVTTCFRGPYLPPYIIQCQVWGQGCTWWTIPNQSVQCTGFDAWGRWVNLYYRCF